VLSDFYWIYFFSCSIVYIGRKLFQLKRFRFSAMSQQSETVTHSPPTSSTDIDTNSKRNNSIELQHHVAKCTFSAHTSNKLNNADIQPNRVLTQQNSPSFVDIPDAVKPLMKKPNNTTDSMNSTERFNASHSDTECKVSKIRSMSRKDYRKNSKIKKRKINYQYVDLRKYTVLMLLISMAFIILSFLPYLGLVTWETLQSKYEGEILSKSELVTFNICLRSWLISSVVNPLIYGFFNTDFRLFVSRLLRSCFCCLCGVSDKR
jgi:hypothetical protein